MFIMFIKLYKCIIERPILIAVWWAYVAVIRRDKFINI